MPATTACCRPAAHGGAGCITAAANVGSAVSAARSYANWQDDKAEAAQRTLTAVRKAVTSVPLIPGLKALISRQPAIDAWHTIRPPHLRLPDADAARLFAAFDATGAPLTDPAEAA